MMQTFRLCLLCLCMWGISTLIHAQPATTPLGVRAAIDLALAQNPMLNQARQQVIAQAGRQRVAWGIHDPLLFFQREGIANGSFTEQQVGISQSFDFPLQTHYYRRQLQAEHTGLEAQVAAMTLRIKAEVKTAYTHLLYALEMTHLRREEVRLATTLLDAVQVRLEVGEAAALALIKAELQVAEAQSNLEEAQRQFDTARYTLFEWIGLAPEDQHYTIVFPDTLTYDPLHLSQEEALGLLQAHPIQQHADQQVRAAEWGIRQTRAAWWPQIQMQYFPQDLGQGYKTYGFQVGLRLPLWYPLTHRGKVQMAKAYQQEQVWTQQATTLALKKQIEVAWHGFDTSRQTIERFIQSVQQRATELMERTLEGYRLGEIDLLALLDTQRTYLHSQQRFYEALRNYYLHAIELEHLLGRDLVFAAE